MYSSIIPTETCPCGVVFQVLNFFCELESFSIRITNHQPYFNASIALPLLVQENLITEKHYIYTVHCPICM